VKEFYERSYQGDFGKKTEAFRWITGNNPFRDRNNNYILIFKNDRMAGYWGLMPIRFYFLGKAIEGVFSQEALIDPYCRREGIATKLLKEINQSGNFMISLWHNEKVLAILKKGGWVDVGNYQPLKKIYCLENLLKLKLKNRLLREMITIFLESYYKMRGSKLKNGSHYSIEFTRKCSNEFDHFFMKVAPKLGILSDRTAVILNWKYIDVPYKEYLFLTARKNGRISGYIVLRIEEQDCKIRKGIIVDLLCDPDEPETLICLAKKCDEIFLENKVDFSVCLVKPNIFRDIFIKNGYFKAKSKDTDSIWIYNQHKSPNRELTKNINSWYFTYGDSDGDMW